MNKSSIVLLIAAIIFIVLFLVSSLAFHNIKTSDWLSLVVGILFLISFIIRLVQGRKMH